MRIGSELSRHGKLPPGHRKRFGLCFLVASHNHAPAVCAASRLSSTDQNANPDTGELGPFAVSALTATPLVWVAKLADRATGRPAWPETIQSVEYCGRDLILKCSFFLTSRSRTVCPFQDLGRYRWSKWLE